MIVKNFSLLNLLKYEYAEGKGGKCNQKYEIRNAKRNTKQTNAMLRGECRNGVRNTSMSKSIVWTNIRMYKYSFIYACTVSFYMLIIAEETRNKGTCKYFI